MDTFECYCRNKWDMTTINKAAATMLRRAQRPCDSLTPSRTGCRACRTTADALFIRALKMLIFRHFELKIRKSGFFEM